MIPFCYVSLCFVKNYIFNKTYEVRYKLPSYKERVKLNRLKINGIHSMTFGPLEIPNFIKSFH